MSNRHRKKKNRKKPNPPKQNPPKKEILVVSQECPICLEGLTDRFTLDCGHEYHGICIREWFGTLINRFKSPNCPVCRKKHEYRLPTLFTSLLFILSITVGIGFIIAFTVMACFEIHNCSPQTINLAYPAPLCRIFGRC
jgi:Ring finger domain